MKIGDQVKIKRGAERFWVTVSNKTKIKGLWWGIIDNHLLFTRSTKEIGGHGLKYKDVITFAEEEILEGYEAEKV